MPINRWTNGSKPAPKEIERLRTAYDSALRRLHLVDRNDPICEIVARKMIEIGADGTRNAQEIAALAAQELAP
jgi:hypothetical protein